MANHPNLKIQALITQIRKSKDGPAINQSVEYYLARQIGDSNSCKKMSAEGKLRAIETVRKIIKPLETRLKRIPRIDLFSAHDLCVEYIEYLWGDRKEFEYIRSRCGRMSCMEDWGWFNLAESEGNSILDAINNISTKTSRKSLGVVLPNLGPKYTNHNCSELVLTVSQTFIRVWWSNRSEEGDNIAICTRIFNLINEMEPWFRHLNQDKIRYKTILEWTPRFLWDSTLSMVNKRQNCLWVSRRYCAWTFEQFEKASMYDHMHKFAQDILDSLFSKLGDKYFLESSIHLYLLDAMVQQYKKHPKRKETLEEFIKLAGNCTLNYGAATGDDCIKVASFLYSITSKYFSEVTLQDVHLILEHYAISLVINHIDLYKRCPFPRFSKAVSSEDFLTRLELHLKEFNHNSFEIDPKLTELFCDRVSTLILSSYKEMIPVDGNYRIHIELPTIVDFLGRFIENCNSESKRHMKQAKVAVAAFLLLLITKKETKNFLNKLRKDGKFQTTLLTYFLQCLHKISSALDESGRVGEAIESLKLCCEASWTRLSLFCDMVSSSTYADESNCSSEDGIVEFVTDATKDSALLLSRIYKRDSDSEDIVSTLITYVKSWVTAQNTFHILSPAALVEEWVRIQYEKSKGEDHTTYLAPTLYSLVPSLKNSKQAGCIILEEELHNYSQMKDHNPEFFERMRTQISDIILKSKSRKHIFHRSKSLVECGMQLGSFGLKGQGDSVTYIQEALRMLKKFNNKDDNIFNRVTFLNLASEAYMLCALMKRLSSPLIKGYTKYIELGLKIFSKQDTKLTNRECSLFSYVLDLLSLEGNMQLASSVYQIMIKRRGRKPEELLNIAWQSGNLTHGLCSSPLNDDLISILPDQSSLPKNNVPFWRTCVTSKSLEASLSVSTTLSSIESEEDTNATKQIIYDAKHADNPFTAARLYYNLAEIMIAKGLMFEALNYANEGYRLRDKLLSKYFIIKWGGEQDVFEGETVKGNEYVIKTFNMHRYPLRLLSLGSFCDGTNVYIPTPWSILRCYLESALQVGTLQYMMGNRNEAVDILLRGSRISVFQGLPVFEIGFSTTLGKIFHKEGSWDLAKTLLDSAQKSLKKCSLNCCKKCICVLGVKLHQELGDLNLSRLKRTDENSRKEALEAAKEFFDSAKSMLEENEWKNSLSQPQKKPPKIPVLCHPIAACGSNEDCWHCLPSVVENSASLVNLSCLKWECIRRRHLLQVLTKLAKCSKLQGDIDEEHRCLMSSMQVLVARSTFDQQNVSPSFVEDMVRENVIADAHGVEQASILYKICCFSLRHNKDLNSETTEVLSRKIIVLGLKMAFILSREVPRLHEKVSQILAVLYACSARPDGVSAVRWAAYFHQSSIGSYFNTCFLSQHQNQMEVDGAHDLRHVLAPRSMKELEESMPAFFQSLPTVTIVCISMLSDKSYQFLDKLLPESPNSVWLMITRFPLENGPIVVILPICETITEFRYNKATSVVGHWTCPLANTEFDRVAPVLRSVLEENSKLQDRKLQSEEWAESEKTFDNTIHRFLRKVEKSWLGPWKNLLLGECLGYHDVDEIKNNYGCYIGESGGKISKKVKEKLGKTNENACRIPVIIVLQLQLQMIPMESMAILRQQEVYRMPSVGSTVWSYPLKNKTVTNPQDCYYLLIPTEDTKLTKMVHSFKEWAKTFGFQGKVEGSVTVGAKELREALESRNLFVYVGHGDGRQYIPGREIRQIDNCCAAILMGCGTGYISSGYHSLDGAPLDYLLGGSPAIVANIWPVRGGFIETFTTEFYEALINVESSKLVACKKPGKKRKREENTLCKHDINMGSYMSLARDACDFRYIHGSAPVIYGIPTRIKMSG